MTNYKPLLLIFSFALFCTCASRTQAQAALPMGYAAAADSKFINLPVLPQCLTLSIQEGDPAKGPLVVLARFKAGCVVPWHFHTATERLLMIKGTGRAEMRDGAKPSSMKPGDYILLPAQGVHSFTAVTDVELFLLADGAFDIHYVDAGNKEISVSAALGK